jgi:hypothetical protein
MNKKANMENTEGTGRKFGEGVRWRDGNLEARS